MNTRQILVITIIIAVFTGIGFVEALTAISGSELILQENENDAHYILGTRYMWCMDDEANIYFLIADECVIMKYSKEGKFLLKFGRKGEGPGEFVHPYKFRYENGALVVYHQLKTYFDKNGEHIKTEQDKNSDFGLRRIKISEGKYLDSTLDINNSTAKLFVGKNHKEIEYLIEEIPVEFVRDSNGFTTWDDPFIATLNSTRMPIYSYVNRLVLKEYKDGKTKILAEKPYTRRKIIYSDDNKRIIVGVAGDKPIYRDRPEYYKLVQHIKTDEDDNIWCYVTSNEYTGFLGFSSSGKELWQFPLPCCKETNSEYFNINGYLYFLLNDEFEGVKIMRFNLKP
ncbi:MAG: hypothetical protein JW737_06910, partial [Acidobacteria bacterium]|nr:hypothetical protein [Acidobacteriota bacterium]